MNKKTKLSAAMVWLFFTLFYCYQYILRILPNLIMPELSLKFGLSATQLGSFAGFFYIGYVALHLPVGLALGRLNSKFILLCAILMTVVGLIPINYGTRWELVVAGRLCIGAGASVSMVGAIQLFHQLLRNHFNIALGGCICCGLFTVFWLSAPIINILMAQGMVHGLNLLILAGLLLAGLTLIFFPNLSVAEKSLGIWADIKAVLGSKKLLFTGVMAGLMVGPLEGFADAWGSAFMQAVHKLDRTSADSLVSAIFLGTCVGYLILPYVIKKMQSYYGITFLAALIMGLGFLYLALGLGDSWILAPLCFIMGICCGYPVVMLAKMVTFVPERLSGLAGSVGNMVLMSFGPLFHYLIGSILDRNWDGAMIEGSRVYPRQAHLAATASIPVGMLFAALGILGLMIVEARQSRSQK